MYACTLYILSSLYISWKAFSLSHSLRYYCLPSTVRGTVRLNLLMICPRKDVRLSDRSMAAVATKMSLQNYDFLIQVLLSPFRPSLIIVSRSILEASRAIQMEQNEWV